MGLSHSLVRARLRADGSLAAASGPAAFAANPVRGAAARAFAAPATAFGRPAEVGVELRSEHDLRVYSAIAMWLGGAGALAAVTVLPGPGHDHATLVRGLVAWCLFAAAFSFVVFRPASDRVLYVLNNLFSTAGAITVFLACLWSGGPSSGLAELYFFPVIYDAYFFRPAHMLGHLLLNSVLALAPLAYAAHPGAIQFPGHIAVLLVAFWSISLVIAHRRRRLLRAEATARAEALSDPLTGLPNLRRARQHADALALAPGHAVLMIDLDDFKGANSRYGHLGADRLLCAVADRLLGAIGDFDVLARVGGDELLLLAAPRRPERTTALVSACHHAIRGAPEAAELGGPPLSASIGMARHPEGGSSFDELIECADRRMLEAKAARDGSTAERVRAAANGSGAPASSRARAPAPGAGAVASGIPRGVPIGEASGAPPGATAAAAAGALANGANGARPVGAATGVPGQRPAGEEAAARGPGRRSSECVIAAIAWLGAAAITTLVALLPGAQDPHPWAIATLVSLAVAAGGFTLAIAPAGDGLPYLVSTLGGSACVLAGVYLTGGAQSPLLPLVFLAVAFGAYFFSPAAALAVLGAAIAVCLSPLAYAGPDARLSYIVRLVVLVSTASILAGIIAYNKRELASAERTARELAAHDPLTGLLNRRAFLARLEDELARAGARLLDGLTVAMIDLDNFKRVNDRHGHAAGDRVLHAIADGLRAVVRRGGCLARIGGDELALILTGADAASASAIADRCIAAIERAASDAGFADCGVSATVGLARLGQHAERVDTLLHAADEALMRAKGTGKRRVAQAPVPATAPGPTAALAPATAHTTAPATAHTTAPATAHTTAPAAPPTR